MERNQKIKYLELASLITVIFLWIIPIFFWSDIPEQVPTHFNFLGEPDSWGSKLSIFLLPIIGLVLYVGFIILGKFPQIFAYPVKITPENRDRQQNLALLLLSLVKVEILLCFGFIGWNTIQIAIKKSSLGGVFIPSFLLILFITLVWYFIKARSLR